MESLGIKPLLLITQIINFLILMGALTFFVYKPLFKALDERKKKIEEGVNLQDKLKKEEEAIEVQKKNVLDGAQDERRQLLKEANQEAKERAKTLLADERAKLTDEEEKLRQELVREKETVLAEAKRRSIHLAILIAEKLLHQKLGDDAQKKLLEQSIAEIEKVK